ncbi:hypothetical protein L7F22_028174 [Adiantum nelumboides]|nr:hypothetical protein [Adiantum nelumboides]
MQVALIAKQKAMKDDCNAFTIAIGTQIPIDADAHLKDISIDRFFVSVQAGKELLKYTSLNIFHGRRYGLFGPNGFSNKYAKKKEMKGLTTMQAVAIEKQEAMKDNYSALTIAIGTQNAVDADANLEGYLFCQVLHVYARKEAFENFLFEDIPW